MNGGASTGVAAVICPVMTVRLRERVPLAAVLSVGTAIVVVLVLVLLLVRAVGRRR